MATTGKWTTAQTEVTVLATELNSLATAALSGLTGSGSGTIIDNTSGLYKYATAHALLTFGVAPTAGLTMDLFMGPSYDDTNYVDSNQYAEVWVGGFQVNAVTTAQHLFCATFTIPPLKLKFALRNNGGQTLAASGNTVGLRTFYDQSV
jgi:hypothetical protein